MAVEVREPPSLLGWQSVYTHTGEQDWAEDLHSKKNKSAFGDFYWKTSMKEDVFPFFVFIYNLYF